MDRKDKEEEKKAWTCRLTFWEKKKRELRT